MMAINILKSRMRLHQSCIKVIQLVGVTFFSFLPGLTVFSQLLNVREINIFPAKLNLESKLRLPHYFHLGNKIVHIVK